jgi:catechol 2,3-dioxygenase
VPIDPATSIGAVHLTIANLTRSVQFYESSLGLAVRRQDGIVTYLGPPAGGDAVLALIENARAPRVRGTTGLYHFAILVPSRRDLAAALHRLVETKTALQGAADHGVSEALYLADPDGNGIEIYRDRPRPDWPIVGGRLRMGTESLDVGNLLEEANGPATLPGLPAGTTIGHVHLHVADLEAARHFYVDLVGFDLMQRYGGAALFVSAGGYHHHVGLNTWTGVGAPPPPSGAIGLRHFVVRLPDAAAVAQVGARLAAAGVPAETSGDGLLVHDPSRNALIFRAGAA